MRFKKLILGMAALAVAGSGYLASKTDYKMIPEVAGIFNSVVLQNNDYSQTLIDELSEQNNEKTADQMIETGYNVKQRINPNSPSAGFSQSPYSLRVIIEHTPKGEEAYLLDMSTNQKLPIYENNHVGDFRHQLKGLGESAEDIVTELFEEAKKTTIDGIETVLKGLE